MRPLGRGTLIGGLSPDFVPNHRQVAQIVGPFGVDFSGAVLVVATAVERGGRQQQHEREEQCLRGDQPNPGGYQGDDHADDQQHDHHRQGPSQHRRRNHPGQFRRCFNVDGALAGGRWWQPSAGLKDQSAHRFSPCAAVRPGRESGARPSWASSASARDNVGPGANNDSTDHGIGVGGGFRPRTSTVLAGPLTPPSLASLSTPKRTPVSETQNTEPAAGEAAFWPTVAVKSPVPAAIAPRLAVPVPAPTRSSVCTASDTGSAEPVSNVSEFMVAPAGLLQCAQVTGSWAASTRLIR